jgi:hypothetical protein
MKIRDMSKKQFIEAVLRNGMSFEGFMGYVNLGVEGQHTSVSHLNAGNNYRAKLAYLLRERERVEHEANDKTKK